MRLLSALALLLAAPGLAAAQAGPHALPDEYAAARGGFAAAAEIGWRVAREPLAGGEAQTSERTMLAGRDFVLDEGADETRLYDFALKRTVAFEDGTYTNTATHADARRNLDIYIQLSQGGEAERIDFGAAGTFDRFWLEAAMGVSAVPAGLESEDTQDGMIWRRDGEEIARAAFGDCFEATLDAPREAALIAGLRRAAPIHPDIGADLAARGEAPCRLAFTIYSPESPDGRRETWTVERAALDPDPQIFPEGAAPVLPEAPFLTDIAGPAALAALDSEAPVPGPLDFMSLVQDARAEGDFAGALLITVRETHHFGPCPNETIGTARLACATVHDLAEAGIGNAAFEQAMEGLNQMQAANHAQAVANLKPFAARDDIAGAAARTIVANELVAWGREGLAAHPDLDPARLLAEAIAIDPLAPDSYWHLGRRYLAAGSPDAAWALFDLGRALPEREITPLLQQAAVLEERIEQLAPGYFSADAQPRASRPDPAPQARAEAAPAPQESPDDDTAEAVDEPAAPPAGEDRAGSAAGSQAVQIGSYRSRDEAERAWIAFATRFPDLVQDRRHEIVAADLGDGAIVHRLRITSFATREAARAYCTALAERGQDCLVAAR